MSKTTDDALDVVRKDAESWAPSINADQPVAMVVATGFIGMTKALLYIGDCIRDLRENLLREKR